MFIVIATFDWDGLLEYNIFINISRVTSNGNLRKIFFCVVKENQWQKKTGSWILTMYIDNSQSFSTVQMFRVYTNKTGELFFYNMLYPSEIL